MDANLLEAYLIGIEDLRESVRSMSNEQLKERPVLGTWSTLEVLCHLADSESVFADRIKRILAEDQPELAFADPKLFAQALAYQQRDAETEIRLIELTRKQIASILRWVPPESWARCGIHSNDGQCSLEQVLTKAVTHLQGHINFIREKRKAMGLS